MRAVTTISLTAILLSIILQSFAASGQDIKFPKFSEAAEATPPMLPEQQTGYYDTEIVLEYNGSRIRDAHVIISLTNAATGERAGGLYYTQKGSASLELKPGRWTGTVGVDEVTDLGSDYFANLEIIVAKPEASTPTLINVGNARGEVYDKEGKLVKGARIKVDCRQYLPQETATDEFGVFFAEYMSPGECKFRAIHGSDTGLSTAIIRPGKVVETEVVLERQVSGTSKTSIYTALAGLAAALALAAGLFLASRKRQTVTKHMNEAAPHKAKEKQAGESASASANQKVEDVIRTLKGREKAVVQFLLQNNNESTQAKILYGTGIPKTSLARVFESLSERNVLEVRKMGKAKKVKLAGWLLGKEEDDKDKAQNPES